MNRQLNMEERLWEYIDGACPAEDRLFIEQLIADNQEWRTKYQELLELQDLMAHHLELDEPSMRFTQNIMEAIGKEHIAPAVKTYINKRIVWGIASFFMVSIIGLLIVGITQVNWTAGGTDSSFLNFNKINLDKIDLSKFFNNTYTSIFMMINVVLGLMLLDMYLHRRKTEVGSKK
jgi:hypothetical protein